jgi:hypothetical protein
MRILGLIMAFVVMAAFMVGCGAREHMREDHGKQLNKFFSVQQVNKRAEPANPEGLDSEEAAAIHRQYRKQLGGGESVQKDDAPAKVLLLKDPKK